jgi:SAM-dependent methyltransferase
MHGSSVPLPTPVEFHELPLFEQAHAWRSYWVSSIEPFVGAEVLEVGAGIGSATAVMAARNRRAWLCLEPDPVNFHTLQRKHASGGLPTCCTVRHGDLTALAADPQFDTVLYVDVLEHIADDRAEVARAAAMLKPGGRLIVVAPAYQFLFTEFDRAIGHYRRYTRAALAALTPAGCRIERSFYLDCVGMIASLGNRLVMHAAEPPAWSIRLWDGLFVPASRILDRLALHSFGKTVVAVWTRER